MNIAQPRSDRGIALMIVMLVVIVLGVLAGGFAYSMRVETRLAASTMLEPDLQWLGRSGVELARYVIAQQGSLSQGIFALNQKWAGGSGNTNDLLAAISLENVELGDGRFTVKIRDAERKFNINLTPSAQPVLQQALVMLGADATTSSAVVDSVLDWIDPDDHSHLSGAESDDYYLRQDPPYYAKNGPLTDIAELLRIRGVTPELFFGFGATNTGAVIASRMAGPFGLSTFSGGLVDLFTIVGNGQVNINTASADVMQMLGMPPDVASSIVAERAGFDGQAGTSDDHVFSGMQELVRWMPPPVAQQLASRNLGATSFFFEVQVDAESGQFKRRYKALLRREPQDVQVLFMYSD